MARLFVYKLPPEARDLFEVSLPDSTSSERVPVRDSSALLALLAANQASGVLVPDGHDALGRSTLAFVPLSFQGIVEACVNLRDENDGPITVQAH